MQPCLSLNQRNLWSLRPISAAKDLMPAVRDCSDDVHLCLIHITLHGGASNSWANQAQGIC